MIMTQSDDNPGEQLFDKAMNRMNQNNETKTRMVATDNLNGLVPARSNRNRFRRRQDEDRILEDSSHVQPRPRRATPAVAASIPLPKSHIRRTPSELQLADATKQAEYENVRMFARLVCGIQSQCQHSGVVHPLTMMSLLTMQQTNDAKDEELERLAEEDDDWGLAYDIEGAARIEMEAEYQYQDETSMDTSEHDRDAAKVANPFAPAAKTPSETSIHSYVPMEEEGGIQEKKEDEDDDFVFDLEL